MIGKEWVMVEIAARRLAPAPVGPAPPATFGVPVMGDPLSVPEEEIGPLQGDGEVEAVPLWLRLPPHLAPYFDLGFAHTDEMCPYVVLRARDDSLQNGCVEVGGPASAFLELAQVITVLCASVPCIQHRASGDLARRNAG